MKSNTVFRIVVFFIITLVLHLSNTPFKTNAWLGPATALAAEAEAVMTPAELQSAIIFSGA